MLKHITMDKPYQIAGAGLTIPEYVYMMYQMTFAIITPALVCGAFAERMKFSALLLFTVLWSIFVYAPIAHWVWGGRFPGRASASWTSPAARWCISTPASPVWSRP